MTWKDSLNLPVSAQGEWAAQRFYGNPEIAALYLPVAYAVLGGVKNQMALSEVSYGHRMVNLPDGTQIRVIRNGDQNIVEINVFHTERFRKLTEGAHGFCFHPKTISNLDGWLYDDAGNIILNDSMFLLNYYFKSPFGLFASDCFGMVYYSSISVEEHRKVIELYEVVFGVYKLSGNQFFYSGDEVYSFFHSAGGDLPMPKEANIKNIGSSLFTPFLRTYVYNADALWTPLLNYPIPKTVFKNGEIRAIFNEYVIGVGVHAETKKEFVVLTFQFRNLIVADMDGKELYTEDIYQRNRQAGYVLDRKAFVNPQGTGFIIISLHPEEYKIHEYSVDVNKDGEFEIGKMRESTTPAGKERFVTTYTSEYSGKSYQEGDYPIWFPRPGEPGSPTRRILYWLVLNNPEAVGDCLYLRGRADEPPPSETRSAGGSIAISSTFTKTSKEPVAVVFGGEEHSIVLFDYRYNSTYTRDYNEASEFTYSYIVTTTNRFPGSACNGTEYLWQGNKVCNTVENAHETITINASFTGGKDEFTVVESSYSMNESATGNFINFPDMDVDGRANAYENRIVSNHSKNRSMFEYVLDYFDFTKMAYIGMRREYAHQLTGTLDFKQGVYQRKPNVYQYDVVTNSTTTESFYYEAYFTNKETLFEYTNTETYFEDQSPDGYYAFPAPDRSYLVGAKNESSSTSTTVPPTLLQGFTKNVIGSITAAIDYRYESQNGDNPYIYDIKFNPYHYVNGYPIEFFHGDSFRGVVEKLPMYPIGSFMIHPVGLW